MRIRLLALAALVNAAIVGVTSLSACTVEVADEPVEYVVVRGDTLFLIAKAHGVTVDQLREWNGLQGDLIEVDQVLRIWASDAEAPVAGTKPAKQRSKRLRVDSTVATTGGTAERPSLELPPEQDCLAGPTLRGDADEGMAASEGLSYEAIRGAVGGFVHNTLPCISGADSVPTSTLELEITVACTGRVAEVRILDQGDWAGEVASCVTDTLRYAPFPAHDLPDGETFRYPLRFTPG